MVAQLTSFLGTILSHQEITLKKNNPIFWHTLKTSLQSEIDGFFIRAADTFISAPGYLWGFLSSIPFKHLSITALWKTSLSNFFLWEHLK